MITWTKRLMLTCTLLGLLATNILTLTSTARQVVRSNRPRQANSYRFMDL